MNALESMMNEMKAPEPTQEKSWIHALPHIWLRLPEQDGNCDALPDRLTPKTGCPKCGSAWLSVEEVAFGSECHNGRLADGPRDGRLEVLQIGGIEPPMAVRLECGGGHLVEFDGKLLKEITPPIWLGGGMLPLIVGGLGVMLFADYGMKMATVG